MAQKSMAERSASWKTNPGVDATVAPALALGLGLVPGVAAPADPVAVVHVALAVAVAANPEVSRAVALGLLPQSPSQGHVVAAAPGVNQTNESCETLDGLQLGLRDECRDL